MALSTLRSELTFLVSVLVPQVFDPLGVRERFTSQRREPSSMRTSETFNPRNKSLNSVT